METEGNASCSLLSNAIARHRVAWERHAWPVNWSGIFKRTGPLEVEAGFGNGSFLVAMARQNPDTNFVGIETSWGSGRRLFRRLAEEKLTNVRVLFGSAIAVLQHVFSPNSIEQLYVNFPDPWRKRSHHDRRIIRADTLELFASRMANHARLNIATDHQEYAQWIASCLEKQDFFRSCFPTASVDRLAGRVPTKYENKALARGERIYYFVWEKIAHPSYPELPPAGSTMPNAILQAPCLLDNPLPKFQPRQWRSEEQGQAIIVKALKLYRVEGMAQFLVDMFVQEGELSQRFGVAICVRPDASILLRLGSLGYPHPTRGVRAAVRCVTQWVLDANPGTRILQNKVGPLEERPTSSPSIQEKLLCEKAP